MSKILSTIGCTAAGAAAIYAFYPAPGFSLAVEKWRASGSYKMFRNYKIFYRGNFHKNKNIVKNLSLLPIVSGIKIIFTLY